MLIDGIYIQIIKPVYFQDTKSITFKITIMEKSNKIRLLSFVLFGSLVFFTACSSTETPNLLPVLTTTAVSNVMETSAKSGGIITSDAGTGIIACGVCWSKITNPTIADNKTSDGNSVGSFTSIITGLNAGTTYYLRAYATNTAGTAYGNVCTFTTLGAITTVKDIDNNIYHTVNIGTQTWMVENLKTTRYRTGESISKDTAALIWSTATYGAWCDYKNDAALGAIYGKLYNYAAIIDFRNIAPIGWHVATDAEWSTLVNFLGGEINAGAKLKETGTLHWKINIGSTNESGFTAIPAGIRIPNGDFGSIGDYAYWWTSTENNSTTVWHWDLNSSNQEVNRIYSTKGYGRSVRCIKD